MPRRQKTASSRALTISMHLTIITTSSCLFVAIILLCRTTNWAESRSNAGLQLQGLLRMDVSTMLTTIRVLQGLLTVLSAISLRRAFLYLKWGFIRKRDGLSCTTLLALSPTTLDWGTVAIIFSPGSSILARVSGLLRLFLMALAGVSGILLFINTSLVTVYNTSSSLEVTAGVGPFNGSYVPQFLEALSSFEPEYKLTTIPYSYFRAVNGLITNPLYSTIAEPISCASNGSPKCASYLLSGGLTMATPWMSDGDPDHPLARIHDVPVVQIEFSTNADFEILDNIVPEDCQIFGSNETLIAANLCISSPKEDVLEAVIFICPNGPGSCSKNESTPHVKTTVAFFERKTTLLAWRANLTVVDTLNLTPSNPHSMTVEAIAQYKAALGWLLDYEAAGIPAPSSIIEVFWSARNDLDSPFLDSHTLQLFQSILAFPVWLFNANNFGDPRRRKKEISPDLPPEFYTTADIIAPYQKIKFDPLILELFCVFQGIVLVFVWAVFLWAIVVAKTLPMVSSYPLFDFAVKPTSNLHDVVSERRHELWDAGDSRTLDIVKYVKVQDKS